MRILVRAQDSSHRARAEQLASEWGWTVLDQAKIDPAGSGQTGLDIVLQVSSEGLALTLAADEAHPIQPDPKHLVRARQGRDDLIRALIPDRSRPADVVDTTGGLGTDAFIVAAAGARVTVIERSPVLYVLLQDALARASLVPAAAAAVGRILLRHGDAREVLPSLAPPDVVYLDPMYPETGKRARKNKEMHLFRLLVGTDPDAGELFDIAQATATRRVVVKRPAKAPPLAPHPSGSITGRTVRFDLYPPAG